MEITSNHIKIITNYMQAHGMAQHDLADKLGIAQPSVNGWLTGRAKTIRNSNWAKLTRMIPALNQVQVASSEEILHVKEIVKQGTASVPECRKYLQDIDESINLIMFENSIPAEKRVLLYNKLKQIADYINQEASGADDGNKEA